MISEEKEVVKRRYSGAAKFHRGGMQWICLFSQDTSDTAYYMFCFPIENHLFQFVYKQQKERCLLDCCLQILWRFILPAVLCIVLPQGD